jgi:hypothetical protein
LWRDQIGERSALAARQATSGPPYLEPRNAFADAAEFACDRQGRGTLCRRASLDDNVTDKAIEARFQDEKPPLHVVQIAAQGTHAISPFPDFVSLPALDLRQTLKRRHGLLQRVEQGGHDGSALVHP